MICTVCVVPSPLAAPAGVLIDIPACPLAELKLMLDVDTSGRELSSTSTCGSVPLSSRKNPFNRLGPLRENASPAAAPELSSGPPDGSCGGVSTHHDVTTATSSRSASACQISSSLLKPSARIWKP